jgi:hypothetical protein
VTTLPPHLARVAAAVETPLGPPVEGAVVDRAVARLGVLLGRQAARLPGESAVVVDHFALTRALTCPASRAVDAEPDPFAWSPRTSMRWLGTKALEAWATGVTPDVAAAVRSACGDGPRDEAEGDLWGPQLWLRDEAGIAERIETIASVQQWAEQAAQWAPWRIWHERGRRLRFEPGRATWPRRSAVAVRGRWLADLRPDPASRQRVQVLLLGSDPSSADATAAVHLAALGGWLAEPRSGRGPARTVTIHPATGDVVAHAIDEALLESAVDDVLTAADTLVTASVGAPLTTNPGPQCRWCPRRDACDEGTAWLTRPDRRIAGLPVTAQAA